MAVDRRLDGSHAAGRRRGRGGVSVETAPLRVAAYSHDTYGLGHLTRTLRLVRGAVESVPGISVLVLTGSPAAPLLDFPAGVDYVKLPSILKVGPDRYAPRRLRISSRRMRILRASLILKAVQLFRPNLFLVDNVPLGVKGELLPALLHLRSARPAARVCLNLRDILDEPSALLSSWSKDGVHAVLDRLYDDIHVFGSAGVFDAASAYRLPVERTVYLGYVCPFPDECELAEPLPPALPGRARVLVTTGGGGDGERLLRCVLALQRKLTGTSPFQFHVVAGPLVDPGTWRAVAQQAQDVEGVTLHDYVRHLPAWMRACDVVLSMGGYNTLCEVMALAQRSVVVPRVYPRREQEIRARALEARGLLRVVQLEELDARSLEETLRDSLQGGQRIAPERCPPLTGVSAFQDRLMSYIHPVQLPVRQAGTGNEKRRSRATSGERTRQASIRI